MNYTMDSTKDIKNENIQKTFIFSALHVLFIAMVSKKVWTFYGQGLFDQLYPVFGQAII